MTATTRRAATASSGAGLSSASKFDDDVNISPRITTNTVAGGDGKSTLTPLRSRRPMGISPPIASNQNDPRRGGGPLFSLVPSSPRFVSVSYMSLSLAIHLAGYELSRAAVMALFTSDGLGFGHGQGAGEGGGGGLSALPLAVGCVSPFSICLLWFYGNTLERGGPAR
jgi:hypothetical protein